MGYRRRKLTRRYHGLLIAAIDPPVERRLVVARLELDVTYDRRDLRSLDEPLGLRRGRAAGLSLSRSVRVERWAADLDLRVRDALLAVTLAMPLGVDATAIAVRVARARGRLALSGRLVVADRDHHGGPLPALGGFATALVDGGATVALPATKSTLWVFARMGPRPSRRSGTRGLRCRVRPSAVSPTWTDTPTCSRCGGPARRDEAGVRRSMDPSVVHDASRSSARAATQPLPGRCDADPAVGTFALAADAFVVTRDRTAAARQRASSPATRGSAIGVGTR